MSRFVQDLCMKADCSRFLYFSGWRPRSSRLANSPLAARVIRIARSTIPEKNNDCLQSIFDLMNQQVSSYHREFTSWHHRSFKVLRSEFEHHAPLLWICTQGCCSWTCWIAQHPPWGALKSTLLRNNDSSDSSHVTASSWHGRNIRYFPA